MFCGGTDISPLEKRYIPLQSESVLGGTELIISVVWSTDVFFNLQEKIVIVSANKIMYFTRIKFNNVRNS